MNGGVQYDCQVLLRVWFWLVIMNSAWFYAFFLLYSPAWVQAQNREKADLMRIFSLCEYNSEWDGEAEDEIKSVIIRIDDEM